MHKVVNCGSALQAYALQRKISELGFEAELIDYEYGHYSIKIRGIKSIITKVLSQIRQYKFNKFYKSYFKCSKQHYTKENICSNPPIYDVYCTGSDQVWNPRWMKADTNFMLSFAPDDKPRFSYAASFTADSIPQEYVPNYQKYLSRYDFITVREQSGVNIVKNLIGKDAKLVCDPTLLLNNNEWDLLANKKASQPKDKYILVYMLGYMFDSRTKLNDIVERIQKTLGYKVVIFGSSLKEYITKSGIIVYDPVDFISYIKNAAFVITDSFHGTAFSAIYDRPFMSIVKDKNNSSDGRISTLLKEIGGENCIIEYDKIPDFSVSEIDKFKIDKTLLEKYRNRSVEILEGMLNSYKNS